MKKSRRTRQVPPPPSADTRAMLGRSRISNGHELLPSVDGRSLYARLMRSTLESFVAHCGGPENISAPTRAIARRAACLEAELVHCEARFAQARADGKAPGADALAMYSTLSNTQRRLLNDLGLQRRPELAPTLDEYLRSKQRHAYADDEEGVSA
jgi:hypothetical protein